MPKIISKIIQKQQFNPDFLGVFINPFCLVRRALWKNISLLAPKLEGKLLDLGCGSKPYKKLFTNVADYIGLEYDSPRNRSIGIADAFYDGKHFPFPDNHFDSILMTQVLEHVFNPDQFLKEVNRVLKPTGAILITVPFVWDEHEQPHDYARYSSFGLTHLLENSGFGIIEKHKTLSDVRVIFQLINCYIHKIIPFKNYKVRVVLYAIFISPLTILGIILGNILPKNTDLYIDNIILARKKYEQEI